MLRYYRRTLLAMLSQLQKIRHDPEGSAVEVLRLQLKLLEKIKYVESRSRAARQDGNLTLRDEYRDLILLLKSIGDSIALFYLSIWDVKPISMHHSPGFILGKSGLRAELAELRRIYKMGGIAILNDITNNLRYGDITILSPINAIIEVKTNKERSRRATRQRRALKKLTDYLVSDDEGAPFGRFENLIRIGVHQKEHYLWRELNALIREAQEYGHAGSLVENGVFYHVSRRGVSPKLIIDDIGRHVSSPILNMCNENKFDNLYYHPFTSSIHEPRAVLDLLCGELFIFVAVDKEFISERLFQMGLTAQFLEDENFPVRITAADSAADDSAKMEVGKHLFNRVFREFLSMDWLLCELVRRYTRFAREEAEVSGVLD